MKTETTLNFTPAQLQELKRLVDVVGWSTRNDETGHIDTYVSESRVQFARNLAGVLNRMDSAALVGTSEETL
jgi:hypothetical protein